MAYARREAELPEELVSNVEARLARGEKKRRIARELGIGRTSVYRIAKNKHVCQNRDSTHKRCEGCGGKVQHPCLRCQVNRKPCELERVTIDQSDDAKRTGRTTAILLHGLSAAIAKQGIEVLVQDHEHPAPSIEHLAELMLATIKRLGLSGIRVRIAADGLGVKSEFLKRRPAT